MRESSDGRFNVIDSCVFSRSCSTSGENVSHCQFLKSICTPHHGQGTSSNIYPACLPGTSRPNNNTAIRLDQCRTRTSLKRAHHCWIRSCTTITERIIDPALGCRACYTPGFLVTCCNLWNSICLIHNPYCCCTLLLLQESFNDGSTLERAWLL